MIYIMLTGPFTKFLEYIKCVCAHIKYKNKQLIILYSITTCKKNKYYRTVVLLNQSSNRLLYKYILHAKK